MPPAKLPSPTEPRYGIRYKSGRLYVPLSETIVTIAGRREDGTRTGGGRLGDRLLKAGAVTEETLQQALEAQRESGGLLGEILVSMGVITLLRLRSFLEETSGFPFVDLGEIEVDRELAASVPEAFLVQNRALPFRMVDGEVHVAMADPLDLAVVDGLKDRFRRSVVAHLAFPKDIEDATRRAFDVRQKTQSVLSEIGGEASTEIESEAHVDDAPIVRLVNGVLSAAFAARASDVHLEPQETNVRVRFRIDGVMYEQMTIPTGHLAACLSRMKVMAGLDIAERRRPQDGRFTTRNEHGHEFDVRLSLMPTVFGEKACLRLLEKTNSLASVGRLGFFPEQQALFEKLIRRPHGLILVTGPTGSGKSTTLYAGLGGINDASININTVEDPVEYKLPGVNQMQVNPKIGVTFASGLRTLVRQDPDVILVGEIRDKETAEIAIQAALTGHLVLSTLHTNDAPGAVVRLQNMGIEPFLISSALVGVVGQRLMRSLCPHCKEAYTPDAEESRAAGLPMGAPLSRGVGCRRCGGRGTQGRSAAVEIMPMTDGLRAAVLEGVPGDELYAKARAEGMVTMRESAVRKALAGTVSGREIVRVFAQED